ncbi:hypothetical protein C8F01DRAFT_1142500 [Mycena amicta]|nr:hypothetical protein C8F01DRAFT_1142500 [Mycena amicta]
MRTVFSVLGFNVISCIRSIDLPVPRFRFLPHTICIDVSRTVWAPNGAGGRRLSRLRERIRAKWLGHPHMSLWLRRPRSRMRQRHIPRLECTSMTRTTPSQSMPVRPRLSVDELPVKRAVFGRPHCPSSCFSVKSNLAKRLRATSCTWQQQRLRRAMIRH